jgi:Cu(I)/Ag(I) efflux system membrane protein CusA/SilA
MKGDLVKEMHSVLQVPGWTNIWTQPIANRIDMLSTGVRTPIGVKVFGPDLETIDRTCKDIEAALKTVPGAQYVVAEPIMGKGYLEIKIDRQRAARYGIQVGDIQDTIEVALGGRMITQTVEGRDRFPVRVRYARDFREDDEAVRHLLVSPSMKPEPWMTPGADENRPAGVYLQPGSEGLHETAPGHSAGTRPRLQIPLGEVADVRIVEGPGMIKSENGQLRNYVTLTTDRDMVGFVKEAQKIVDEKVTLPEGVHIEWSGEFENQVRAARTNLFVFPATMIIIFVILYLTYKDLADAGLMMLAVPEALAGGAFLMAAWHWLAPPVEYSVAVQVGFIACFGMATETGIIMLVYLRDAIDKRGGLAGIGSLAELRQAVIEGAVHRLRPKLLTEGVAIIALAPMLWATGVGAEIIKPMAIPVLGGLLIADEVVDIFLPVRFYWVRRARWLKLHPEAIIDDA